MKNTTRHTERATWLAALGLLTMTTACGGGGGGGSNAQATLGALTSTANLAAVNMADASLSLRTGPGPTGYPGIICVALDPVNRVLYGMAGVSSSGTTALLRIDPSGGPAGLTTPPTLVGDVTFGASSLAWHPTERMLYGVALQGSQPWNPARLVRIDPVTAESEVVGPCSRVTTLEYDPGTGFLYGVYFSTFRRIAPATGASLDLFQESFYLPMSTGLTLDPLSGLFHASYHDLATPPGIVTVDLNGLVGGSAATDQPLDDLVLDPSTGKLIGLTTGHGLVSLQPPGGTSTKYTTTQLGNVGCTVQSLAFDPADKSFFCLDLDQNLVKFSLTGGCRTLGPLATKVRTIAYDPLLRELWGVDYDTDQLLAIDPVTAAVTLGPVPVTVATGLRLAIEPASGAVLGYDNYQVTWLVDVHAGIQSPSSTSQGLPPLTGLTFDPLAGRLVASWHDSFSKHRISSWNPNVSSSAQTETPLPLDFPLQALEFDSTTGTLFGFSGSGIGQALFEIDLQANRPGKTVNSVRDRNYRSTVYIPEKGRIFAIDATDVYSIDPATGATEIVGSQPGSGGASAITWRPDQQQLGILKSGVLQWTSPSAPWFAQSTSILASGITKIAYSPERGLYYGIAPFGLFSIAINQSSAAVITIKNFNLTYLVTDMTWKNGSLFVATNDDRLFELDPDTGAWTERGKTRTRLAGLY